MKKKYIKPKIVAISLYFKNDNVDSFSLPGELLTGSIKDKSSDDPGVKGEIIWGDDDIETNNCIIHSNSLWNDEW